MSDKPSKKKMTAAAAVIANRRQVAVDLRRSKIAALLVRKPTITQRQILGLLTANGIVNPETGEPYGLGTINADMKAIREEWRKRAEADIDDWIAGEAAKLDALEEQGWLKENLSFVLDVMAMRAKLLRLHSPLAGVEDAQLVIAVVKASVDVL